MPKSKTSPSAKKSGKGRSEAGKHGSKENSPGDIKYAPGKKKHGRETRDKLKFDGVKWVCVETVYADELAAGSSRSQPTYYPEEEYEQEFYAQEELVQEGYEPEDLVNRMRGTHISSGYAPGPRPRDGSVSPSRPIQPPPPPPPPNPPPQVLPMHSNDYTYANSIDQYPRQETAGQYYASMPEHGNTWYTQATTASSYEYSTPTASSSVDRDDAYAESRSSDFRDDEEPYYPRSRH